MGHRNVVRIFSITQLIVANVKMTFVERHLMIGIIMVKVKQNRYSKNFFHKTKRYSKRQVKSRQKKQTSTVSNWTVSLSFGNQKFDIKSLLPSSDFILFLRSSSNYQYRNSLGLIDNFDRGHSSFSNNNNCHSYPWSLFLRRSLRICIITQYYYLLNIKIEDKVFRIGIMKLLIIFARLMIIQVPQIFFFYCDILNQVGLTRVLKAFIHYLLFYCSPYDTRDPL